MLFSKVGIMNHGLALTRKTCQSTNEGCWVFRVNTNTAEMCAARIIAENFQEFSSSYAQTETGGLLNFLFDPVKNASTDKVLLKQADLSLSSAVDYLKTTIFNATPSVRVLEVLPVEVRPSHIEDNAYGIAVGLAVAAIILAALSVVILFVISALCCFRSRSLRNRIEKGNTEQSVKVHSMCYLISEILSIVMITYLVLCAIVGFIAVGSLVDGVNSKAQDQGVPSGLAASAITIFAQAKLFLQDFIQHGRNATAVVINELTKEIKDDLEKLIRGILENLLTSYGVRNLLDELTPLGSDIESLETTAKLVASTQSVVIADISTFQGKMSAYQYSLYKSFYSLCPKLSNATLKCMQLSGQLNILNVSFNENNINTEPSVALTSLVTVFGTNMSTIIRKFSNLEEEINAKASELIVQVQDQVNFDEQFGELISIWDKLNSEVAEPTTTQIDDVQPVVDKAIEFAAVLFAVVGYVCMAIAIIILIIMLIYLVLCALEARRKGLISRRISIPRITSDLQAVNSTRRGSKLNVSCGAAVVAIFGIFLLVMVVVSAIITTFLILMNDEACRYLHKPSAMRITDAALDLFVEYEWPTWITNEVIPRQVQNLLQLQPPRQILYALINKCQPVTATEFIPLLPNLGLENLVNVTAILSQPELKNAIEKAEKEVVQEVLKVNFSSYIPQNVDDILKTVENLTNYLDNSNYTESIHELTTAIIDVPMVTAYLLGLKNFVDPYTSTQPEAVTIRDTIDACLADLQEADSLSSHALQLANLFTELQKYQVLSPQLQNISATLQSVIQILSNSTAVVDPLVSAYRAAFIEFFAALNTSMDAEMARFTSQVVSCSRLHIILKSTLEITCGNTGLLNRLGGLMFILALLSLPMLIASIIFQVFLSMHEQHSILVTS
ncbi:unnamed protein product [Dicrocoelium dendriticum]|nr:unnamed protein product [Dicrocoelium dendriticum]